MNDPLQRVPTIIITGFLGSGKTTMIKHLLETSLNGKKVALIENEIGDVSVDSVILKTQNVEISELTSGCMCCTISGDFSNAVSDILQNTTPDVLLIETTGIANPISIFMMLANDRRLILDMIITVADADNLWENLQENLVAEIQLSICDVVVLNKADLCTEGKLKGSEELAKKINERAPILKAVQGKIPPELLLTSSYTTIRSELQETVQALKKKYDTEIERRLHEKREAESAAVTTNALFPIATVAAPDGGHHHHHHDHTNAESYHLEIDAIETFAFEFKAENLPRFSQAKFEDFLAALPKHYYRAKGVVNFAEMRNPTIFNFSSGRYTFDYETLESENYRLTNPSSVFVFIGKRIEHEETAMREKLMQCVSNKP
jgi:G3E family GTPase